MKKNIIIFVISTLLLFTQLLFVGKNATFGKTVFEQERKIGFLKEENQKLEEEIASVSSCSALLGQKAEDNLADIMAQLRRKNAADLKVAMKQ